MGPLQIRPGDRLIKNYYESLHQFGQLEFDHEGAVRSAFQAVLDGYGKRLEWKLVPEYPYKKVRVDGALLDTWKQRRGFWEAKDVNDDLEKEIRSKIERGYPTTNIIFQAPERAILYQRGIRVGLNENIGDAKNLVELLKEFFSYKEPEHEEWDKAVDDFSERLPEIAKRAKDLIDHERVSNKAFRDRFEEFYALCQRSINPNLSFEAVEEMLIQHLLTERIFRRVLHAEEFRTRNVIAQEIEKVISSLTSRHFSRDAFLSEKSLFESSLCLTLLQEPRLGFVEIEDEPLLSREQPLEALADIVSPNERTFAAHWLHGFNQLLVSGSWYEPFPRPCT